MSIQNEIDRITNNVAEAYTAVEEKGGNVPTQANSNNLPAAIATIPEMKGIPVKPVTESEYNALSEEERNGETAWLVTDAEAESSGGVGAGDVYSTEEMRIGTWIDGKPLYRKVVSFTNTLDSWDLSNNLVGLDIEAVIDVKGYVRNRSASSTATFSQYNIGSPNITSSKTTGFTYKVSGSNPTKLSISTIGLTTGSGSYDYAVILEYTKTTD